MNNIYNKYSDFFLRNSVIDESKYQNYNIKKGLRNSDNTGVILGITKVGAVIGYEKIDNKKVALDGLLYYRDIEINNLISKIKNEDYRFEKTNYLLLFAKIPTNEELRIFLDEINRLQVLEPKFVDEFILNNPSKNMMNQLQRNVLDLYLFDNNPDEITINNLLKQAILLTAKLPIMLVYGYLASNYKYNRNNLVLKQPKKEYSIAKNILYLLREDGKFSELEAELLDLMLLIHADHGAGNNSTFSTRVVSSTQTDTYSAISAAIGSLKGPKHGGANVKVKLMVEDLKRNTNIENKLDIVNYIKKIIKKEAFDKQGLVYGMGHAIYTKSDPRALIIKEKAYQLALEKNRVIEYEMYQTIEKSSIDIFKEIKGHDFNICANVDLYSGFVYEMLEIPFELYTSLFAIARISSWNAHRLEQIFSENRIIRPAYISIDNYGNIIK